MPFIDQYSLDLLLLSIIEYAVLDPGVLEHAVICLEGRSLGALRLAGTGWTDSNPLDSNRDDKRRPSLLKCGVGWLEMPSLESHYDVFTDSPSASRSPADGSFLEAETRAPATVVQSGVMAIGDRRHEVETTCA